LERIIGALLITVISVYTEITVIGSAAEDFFNGWIMEDMSGLQPSALRWAAYCVVRGITTTHCRGVGVKFKSDPGTTPFLTYTNSTN
jgi:hypothetical protein